MGTRTVSTGGFGIDARDLKGLIRALRTASPQLVKDLRTDLKAGGELVADEARRIASEVSTSTPPTIKTRVSGAKVSIIAGSNDVPIAGLLEEGNSKGGGSGFFRHPVFGDKDVWADQKMHPYLVTAVHNKEDAVVEAVTAALDAMAHTVAYSYLTE